MKGFWSLKTKIYVRRQDVKVVWDHIIRCQIRVLKGWQICGVDTKYSALLARQWRDNIQLAVQKKVYDYPRGN